MLIYPQNDRNYSTVRTAHASISMETIHEQQHAQPGTRARPNLSSTTCSRAPMRTKPWQPAHSCKGHGAQAAGGSGHTPCLELDRARASQAGRRSAQVCARDWHQQAGGGGSGSILRGRDWIQGRAGLGSKEGFEKASREAVSPPTSSSEGGAHLAPGTASPRCSRSMGPRLAARITALRARDGESERFRQRSTWRSGRVSEGRSPANKGRATR